MSQYTSNFSITPGPGAKWTLLKPLTWEIGFKGSNLTWTVPAGFVTDLATIPRFARFVFDRGDSRYGKAAALHDHLLAEGFDRLTAAGEFHSALRADGVVKWRRLVLFLVTALWRFD